MAEVEHSVCFSHDMLSQSDMYIAIEELQPLRVAVVADRHMEVFDNASEFRIGDDLATIIASVKR